MDCVRSGWVTNFFDRNMVIIPLVAIPIARTNPTPSHDTTAVYPTLKSVSPPSPLAPYLLLTITHPDPDHRLGP